MSDGIAEPSSPPQESSLTLEAVPSSALTDDLVQRLLTIFEENMGELYRVSSWGLKLNEKEEELRHRKARYLLVWEHSTAADDVPTTTLAAFCHYRFCLDDDERPDWPVLCIYEIQVALGYQRRGLGQALMRILQEIGRQTDMAKVLLTVFSRNVEGIQFYREKCGYTVDESDPSIYGDHHEDYSIFSKVV